MTTDTQTAQAAFETITSTLVPEHRRLRFLPTHFGPQLMLTVEGEVFNFSNQLTGEYRGGYWDFIELSNGGCYMRPNDPKTWKVSWPDNFFEGEMSSDALGITATLFALSHLSMRYQAHRDVDRLTDHFHALRDFVGGHPEARTIFSAID